MSTDFIVQLNSQFNLFMFLQLSSVGRDISSQERNFAQLRWNQTAGYGYVTNPRQKKVFMAVAMDLGNPFSPFQSSYPLIREMSASVWHELVWLLCMENMCIILVPWFERLSKGVNLKWKSITDQFTTKSRSGVIRNFRLQDSRLVFELYGWFPLYIICVQLPECLSKSCS